MWLSLLVPYIPTHLWIPIHGICERVLVTIPASISVTSHYYFKEVKQGINAYFSQKIAIDENNLHNLKMVVAQGEDGCCAK